MSTAELAEGARPVAHRVDEQVVLLRDPMEDPDDVLRASRSREKSYVFDVAFDSTATQETVYRATTRGLIAGVISGYNATVFAYGPTGCGKTYTMLGTNGEPGICTRTLGDLFQAIEDASGDTEYKVSMSYLELLPSAQIYNEMVRDLLNPSLGCLQLREDASGTVRVAGITEVSAIDAEEVSQRTPVGRGGDAASPPLPAAALPPQVMQLLARGNRQRTQEPTAANRTSSRSHAVLQVTVRQRRRGGGLHRGRLFMVDLAGSERAAQVRHPPGGLRGWGPPRPLFCRVFPSAFPSPAQTQNRGQRMKEGAHINRSLLALGNCIKALSDQASTKYINYRDSKLTRLLKVRLGVPAPPAGVRAGEGAQAAPAPVPLSPALRGQDSLGGNSRTVMIAHISPASTAFEESRSTLAYARRAKSIRTTVGPGERAPRSLGASPPLAPSPSSPGPAAPQQGGHEAFVLTLPHGCLEQGTLLCCCGMLRTCSAATHCWGPYGDPMGTCSTAVHCLGTLRGPYGDMLLSRALLGDVAWGPCGDMLLSRALPGDPTGTLWGHAPQPCTAWGPYGDPMGTCSTAVHCLGTLWEPYGDMLLSRALLGVIAWGPCGDLLHQLCPVQGPHLGPCLGPSCAGAVGRSHRLRPSPVGLGADAPCLQPGFRCAVPAAPTRSRAACGRSCSVPATSRQPCTTSSSWRTPSCTPSTSSPLPGTWGQSPPRTRQSWQWSKEGLGEPDGPGDSERDSDTGDKRLDVPEPPDVAAVHEGITALVEEQGRLQQRKVWEPLPHHQQLKPHHRGAEFDKSQPSSTGHPAALGGHGYSWTGVWVRGKGPGRWQGCWHHGQGCWSRGRDAGPVAGVLAVGKDPDPAACLQAELARRFRQSQQRARWLEEALRHRSSSEEPREVLALLCHLHQLELETAETRSRALLEGGLRHLPATAAQRFDRHRALCARIIHQQRQLIADHRLSVPRPLEELYETYLRELAGGPGDTGTLKRPDPRVQEDPTGTAAGERGGAHPTSRPGHGGPEHREMSSSTKSIVAKAAWHRSRIPESTPACRPACLHSPGSAEERGGPGQWHAASEDSPAGMAARSPGARLRARKKGSKELGRSEESLDGRRRSRRSPSFEVTGRG
ncbi:hypothetical protein QYF61_026892, partial [Mycteria americana]